jgi:hypothetical protein
MATTAMGLTYPDTRGSDVEWADGHEANLSIINNFLAGTHLYNITRSSWEVPRSAVGYFGAVTDNGSGKVRITVTNHGLATGDSVNLHDCSVSGYNGTGLSVTKISNNVFDITSKSYSATSTGYWYCESNVYRATNQYSGCAPGDTVRRVFVVGMPNGDGTSKTLFTCSNYVRADYGGVVSNSYQRSIMDNFWAGLFVFIRNPSTGAVVFFSDQGAQPTGRWFSIDFVA